LYFLEDLVLQLPELKVFFLVTRRSWNSLGSVVVIAEKGLHSRVCRVNVQLPFLITLVDQPGERWMFVNFKPALVDILDLNQRAQVNQETHEKGRADQLEARADW
jgi:hypothetical protein